MGAFRIAPLYSWVIVALLQTLFAILGYFPDVVPIKSLGAFGDVLRVLCVDYRIIPQAAFWFLVIAHTGEALYAAKIANDAQMSSADTLKWMLQTFIVGFPSLILLKKTRKALRKKKPQ